MKNFKQRSVDVHDFAMIPRSDIPRSSFRMDKNLKTTFDAGYLVPIFCEEVLPGDTFNVKMTAFCRLATPLFPVMDNLHLETFFFFVPNRLTWANWKKFMGEQESPGDSISYIVPYMNATARTAALTVGSLADYFGIPVVGQANTGFNFSALPFRAYGLIWNNWFRDENLQNWETVSTADGPDTTSNMSLLKRGKRKDYFTGCLPWPQKGSTAISMPLAGTAPIVGLGIDTSAVTFTTNVVVDETDNPSTPTYANALRSTINPGLTVETTAGGLPLIYADLAAATGATINQLRQSFQVQKLLERDARGGTRYTEIVRSHFGVVSPDARLQRPEYLGGGHTPIMVNPIANTSSATGSDPVGELGAMATALANGHGFSQSFTEHGYIIGLASVRADLTYQQGLRRHWSRSTRYDFYFPAFATLGEQAVLNKEIYCQGNSSIDDAVFGYQERWAEYRYNPSEITGLFRSTSSGTIDPWHLAQKFTALPTLNTTFIQETPPVSRVVAVGTGANGQQFLMDCFFSIKAARPLPMYSVPGLIDHF